MQSVDRLISTFVPEHYDLSLVLHRESRSFDGTVAIHGTSPNAEAIKFHAKDLTINSVTYDGKSADFSVNDDEVHISHSTLSSGAHVLVIGFSGVITDSMHGMYPCYYTHDGVEKELLATQFESHHAREVFPCIDEPEAKATFSVTLTTEPQVTVLGNMPVAQQREENGLLVTSFQKTPRMSTYLLAWAVGELHRKSATTKNGVEVNVWATLAQPAESLDFPLDIAVRTIDFLDDYFDTPYPLPKSDHIALPDFSSAAMENWGLVTYREVALLADPASTSILTKRQAATIIAHELSHQWFGNLVTMKWWNDLWLNESFANIMEYVVIDALQPDWEIWLEHASYEVVQALRRDALDGVRAIRTDISHPDEISSLFDPSIVYAKGGRLIRMLQQYIGEDTFRVGLRDYFKKFAYKNTEADDLWACFSAASGKDIAGFMHDWMNQPGFPVVHQTGSGARWELRQEQFFIGDHSASTALWPVPLTGSVLLDSETATITPPKQKLLNAGATAHFVSHYDTPTLDTILASLESLSDVDRLELINEQVLLTQGAVASAALLIPLLERYANEQEEAVWNGMVVAITELKKFVETDEAAEQKLRNFVGRLAHSHYTRLGWDRRENESEDDTKFRSLIISQMLYSEHPEVIAEALARYNKGIDTIDPELRVAVMATAIRHGDTASVFDTLLEAHQRTANSELQEDIAAALTAAKDPAILKRIIRLFENKEYIRPQDLPRWFIWVLRNRYGREMAWQWARDEWKWIQETFKGDHYYDMIPRYIASSLVTQRQKEEYDTFFTPLREQPALRRNIEIGSVELAGRVEQLERDGASVRSALAQLD